MVRSERCLVEAGRRMVSLGKVWWLVGTVFGVGCRGGLYTDPGWRLEYLPLFHRGGRKED